MFVFRGSVSKHSRQGLGLASVMIRRAASEYDAKSVRVGSTTLGDCDTVL